MAQKTQVFERTEQKYHLTREQAEAFCRLVQEDIRKDAYPVYTVQNLYLDTEDDRLIRKSLDKPAYREKLRIRTYGHPESGDPLFLEVKKKYRGRSSKRRMVLNAEQLDAWLAGVPFGEEQGQMGQEFNYIYQLYQPQPRMYIAYDRVAYQAVDDPAVRITFDRNIRWRITDLHLHPSGRDRLLVLPRDCLMEIKIADSYPLWLARALSVIQARPSAFSKYGTAWQVLHQTRPVYGRA